MASQKLQRCVNAKQTRMTPIKTSAELKLALFPTRSPLPFAALPSISLTHELDCADLHRFGIRVSSFLRPSTFGLRHFQNFRDIRTTTDGNRRSWRKFFVRPRDR
jgi:hypothetical protein